MFTCYPLSSILLYFDHFARQSFYIHQRDSTFCSCAPAGVRGEKPLRGEIGALLRCHFEGPNVLATIHLQLQLSRFQEPPCRQIGAVQKISNCKKLHGIPNRGTEILCSITSISLSLSPSLSSDSSENTPPGVYCWLLTWYLQEPPEGDTTSRSIDHVDKIMSYDLTSIYGTARVKRKTPWDLHRYQLDCVCLFHKICLHTNQPNLGNFAIGSIDVFIAFPTCASPPS